MVIVGTGGTKRIDKELWVRDVIRIWLSKVVVWNMESTHALYFWFPLHSTYRVYEVGIVVEIYMPYPEIVPVVHGKNWARWANSVAFLMSWLSLCAARSNAKVPSPARQLDIVIAVISTIINTDVKSSGMVNPGLPGLFGRDTLIQKLYQD